MIVVAGALVLAYFFLIKKNPDGTTLLSSSMGTNLSGSSSDGVVTSEVSKDFISLLLSVRSIKLDDSILNDQAFLSLRDTTISIVPDSDEGRPNPFAPIGAEFVIWAPEKTDNSGTNPKDTKKTTSKKDQTNTNPPPADLGPTPPQDEPTGTNPPGDTDQTPDPIIEDPNPDLNTDPALDPYNTGDIPTDPFNFDENLFQDPTQ